jgi:hypothetical protein
MGIGRLPLTGVGFQPFGCARDAIVAGGSDPDKILTVHQHSLASSRISAQSATSMELPEELESAIAQAASDLLIGTTCSVDECETHKIIIVQGWASTPETIRSMATYLVGLLASAISVTLDVRAQITDSKADRLELLRSTQQIVGSAAKPLSTDQKQDQRNPWIAEGLWHLYYFLASRQAVLHPPGNIVALDFPHVSAKDHGLDILAIYRAGSQFGLSIVECKAYENDPNGAVNDAVRTFKQIDEGKHDARIRQFVAAARSALPAAQQGEVSPSLWKDVRTYVPNPHYDSQSTMTWSNKRPSFAGLSVPAERVIVMPHAIKAFATFFDDVGSAMLEIAERFNV